MLKIFRAFEDHVQGRVRAELINEILRDDELVSAMIFDVLLADLLDLSLPSGVHRASVTPVWHW